MSVFFRTGENSAIGIPWPIYLVFVLPFQLLYGFAKMLVLGFKWLAIGTAALVALVFRVVRGHEEDRPPTP